MGERWEHRHQGAATWGGRPFTSPRLRSPCRRGWQVLAASGASLGEGPAEAWMPSGGLPRGHPWASRAERGSGALSGLPASTQILNGKFMLKNCPVAIE